MEDILRAYQNQEVSNNSEMNKDNSNYNIFNQAVFSNKQNNQQKIIGNVKNLKLVKNQKMNLDQYLQKCLDNCTNKKQRKLMKKTLIDKVKNLKANNDIEQYDFAKEPIINLKRDNKLQVIKVDKNGNQQKNNSNSDDDENEDEGLEQYGNQLNNLQKKIIMSEGTKNAIIYIKQEVFKTNQLKNPFVLNQNQENKGEDIEQLEQLTGNKKQSKKLQLMDKIKKQTEFSMVNRFAPIEQNFNEDNEEEQDDDEIDLDSYFKQSDSKKNNGKQIQIKKMTQIQIKNEINSENMRYKQYEFKKGGNNQQNSTIVGTCQDLEKEYFRIQGEPKPYEIRPLDVLKKSLNHVLNKYERTQDYLYIQQQLRSIRQDLLVQRIRNQFTLKVFEENCRICLENSDKFEFTRTLHEVMSMYNQGIKGNQPEFTYYSILLHTINKDHKSLQEIYSNMNDTVMISDEVERGIQYGQAFNTGNVFKFFQMYRLERGYGKFIIDLFIDEIRKWGMKLILKAYGPKEIPVNLFIQFLGFSGFDQCYKYLLSIKAFIYAQNVQIKETLQVLNQKA